jgi:hypothetical protein
MPAYDGDQFEPPAPVAYVTLRHPSSGALLSDVPMLMDTGADVTLLPRLYVDRLGISPLPEKVYELRGFDGSISQTEAVLLELVFLERKFRGQFLLIDQPVGILGRNILNALTLLLDGPHGRWDEQKG